ncbi:MAG TPA: cupin domain-containing protein [Pseudonocardia sp.]|jgi:quercetin dioxygenase-like cupin family protein
MSGPSSPPVASTTGAAHRDTDPVTTVPATALATAAVARESEVEVLVGPHGRVHLLLDGSDTGGALSTLRVELDEGSDGATPHLHRHSSELLHVLEGAADVLTGDRVITATAGDLVVIPPGLPHAFAAARGHRVRLLLVFTPGIDRFDLFRSLHRVVTGTEPADGLLDLQDEYDTHFLVSPPWRAARARPNG